MSGGPGSKYQRRRAKGDTSEELRHSGLGPHTPADVHYGTAEAVRDKRATVLDHAYRAHPERFVRNPPERRSHPSTRGSTRPTRQRNPLSKCRSTMPQQVDRFRLDALSLNDQPAR
jgi:hypothetical protein